MKIISNCRQLDWGSYKMLGFEFFGGSMTNFSNPENASRSIFERNSSKPIIFCNKNNSLEPISKEIITTDGKFVVVLSFFDEPFLAEIKSIKSGFILFQFLNSDKSKFPDQYLRISEIKSIHIVEQIQMGAIVVTYNSDQEGGSTCA